MKVYLQWRGQSPDKGKESYGNHDWVFFGVVDSFGNSSAPHTPLCALEGEYPLYMKVGTYSEYRSEDEGTDVE